MKKVVIKKSENQIQNKMARYDVDVFIWNELDSEWIMELTYSEVCHSIRNESSVHIMAKSETIIIHNIDIIIHIEDNDI